jgi:hypothetical protein
MAAPDSCKTLPSYLTHIPEDILGTEETASTHIRSPDVRIHRRENLNSLSLSICASSIRGVYFFYYWWGGTKSIGTAATSGLLYKPQIIEEGDCGAIGRMKIGRGNRSTRRKPAPAPLFAPQNPT